MSDKKERRGERGREEGGVKEKNKREREREEREAGARAR